MKNIFKRKVEYNASGGGFLPEVTALNLLRRKGTYQLLYLNSFKKFF